MNLHIRTPALLLISSFVLLLPACATKKFVREEIASRSEPTEARVTDLESGLEENQQRISETSSRVDDQGRQIESTSQTAQDALDRAVEAGKLAEGTLVSETVLSDDKVRFVINQTELSDEAKAALDEFIAPFKSQNQGIYIEIQGHTDNTGSDLHNLRIGEQRAETVRRYLNAEHGVPLHRMNVISYGETEPAYDNATLEGRRANRRVVLVVLK